MKFIYTFANNSNEAYRVGIILEDGDDKTQVVIPDSYNGKKVTHLSAKLFDEFGSELKTIVFGDNIELISPYTLFSKLEGLETVYLGKGIKSSIAKTNYCPNLKNVFYNGTKEEWKKKIEESQLGDFESFDVQCGVLTKKVQLSQSGNPVFPITHWDCIKGVPESFPGNGGSGNFVLKDKCIQSEHLADGAVKNTNIEDLAVTGKKIMPREIEGAHIKQQTITNDLLSDQTITGDKVKNKAISKDKLSFDVATEDFVKNSIKNASGNSKIIKDVISNLEEDENIENLNVVKTNGLIKKEWSKVKIWSANDGIESSELNPTAFDFSQIGEVNYTKITRFPDAIDMSSLNGRDAISAIVFQDQEVKRCIVIQVIHQAEPQGTGAEEENMIYVQFYDGMNDTMYFSTYNEDSGWSDETLLGKIVGTYPSMKIVDFASLHIDDPDITYAGYENVPDFLINFFLKDCMQVYYPEGYYLTEKPSENNYVTSEELNTIIDSFAAMLDAANREVI